MTEEVVLVDEKDRETGTMEKIEAHKKGILHRAFSVFVLNSKGMLLLQRRASVKYHSPGLWTNTCCSHPRPGESVKNAALRRLKEEMGITCSLTESFTFIYRAEFDNGLTEHEYDHVLIGVSDSAPDPDPAEVDGYEYADLDLLSHNIEYHPEDYTVWFRIAYPRVKERLKDLLQ
ncbi:MAG: isopentenyl-diphosphate Delta-isomerase [Bacteroidales bacterium]